MVAVSQVPWIDRPTLDFDLDVPVECRFRDVPTAAVAHARALLASIGEQFPAGLEGLADAIAARTAGRFDGEFRALAELAGASWREIALANVSYDLTMALGCSTVALPTADGPVLARNMDWWPEDLLARSSYRIRLVSGGELRVAHAGWPGGVGVVTGLSSRGFAIALNSVLGPENRDLEGHPVLLHLRRVLEDAADFDAAVESLRATRLATSALFTVVGRENRQRVVVERSTGRAALREAEPHRPLVATNHYRRLFREEEAGHGPLFDTSCGRFDALLRHFDGHDPRTSIPDQRLLYVLTEPDVILGITAQHVVMRPAANDLRVYVPRRYVGTND
jgi:hypothetical protein